MVSSKETNLNEISEKKLFFSFILMSISIFAFFAFFAFLDIQESQKKENEWAQFKKTHQCILKRVVIPVSEKGQSFSVWMCNNGSSYFHFDKESLAIKEWENLGCRRVLNTNQLKYNELSVNTPDIFKNYNDKDYLRLDCNKD